MDATSVALRDTLAPSLPDGGTGGGCSSPTIPLLDYYVQLDATSRIRPLLLRPAGAFTTRRRRAPPSTLAFSSRPLRASPTTPAGAFSTRTIAAHHARSYSGQPALTTLFLRAPSTRTEIATRTIDAHHARSYSGQPALLLRCFYAHHRRAPKSRIAPCWAFRPPTRHTEPYGPC